MFSSTRFMFARATAATSVPKRDFTRVTVMGRVGNEPELRNFDGGAKMISFSLAVDRKSSNSMTSAEQRKKNTMWFRVFFFETGSALTKVVDEKVTKGALVLIDGELTQRQFKGKTGFDNNVTDIHIGNGLGRIRVIRSTFKDKDAAKGAAGDDAKDSADGQEAPADVKA